MSLEGDGEAQPLQAVDEAQLEAFAFVLVEVLRPQLAVGLVAGKHVLDRDEDRGAHGQYRPTLATTRGDAAELGGKVGTLRPARHVGHLGQGTP